MKILLKSDWEDVKCPHDNLRFEPSPWASKTGYVQPNLDARIAACRVSSDDASVRVSDHTSPGTFPAPLLFPEDELDFDPKYPAQDVQSWKTDKDRNPVTPERKTIYVVPPPETDDEVFFVEGWAKCARKGKRLDKDGSTSQGQFGGGGG